jgi:ABC-type nickel/cobalt efflux system permease component RcnA
VPGGVGAEIPEIFQAADLTPIVALGSILLAMALGAGHALTPGHGKTLMAAYLVGTRGTIRHAAGLGLAVTVSHTIGILLLALLVTGAEAALPADLVVRAIPVVAALAFVAIGGWMVIGEVRARRRARRAAAAHDHEHAATHGHAHENEHGHAHENEHGHAHENEHGHAHENEHGDADAGSDAPGRPIGEHSHGGMRHSHLPADDRTRSWGSDCG